MTLNIFEHWTRVVFLGTAESFQLRIEISDKHDIFGKFVDGFKQCKVRISIWAQRVAKMRFWLSERSMSIAKASLWVMILKSVLRYSLLIIRQCFTRKATPPQAPVELSFLIVKTIFFYI